MLFEISSALCFSLEQSEILSSVNGLNNTISPIMTYIDSSLEKGDNVFCNALYFESFNCKDRQYLSFSVFDLQLYGRCS